MKNRLLVFAFLLHVGVSLGAFIGLNAWAVGIQDAGTPPTALVWAEFPVNFVLLQPIAYWVVDGLAIAWWTWPGLATLAALVGLNSAIVVIAVAACGAALRRWSNRGREARI